MQAILRHINFDTVKCVVIASPGFVKDQFFEYMFQTAVKTDNKVLLDNKGKFILIHSSSGFKHSLTGSYYYYFLIKTLYCIIFDILLEVLQDGAVISAIEDTKAAGEVEALKQFYVTLRTEPAKAFYGKKHIEKANEAQAIETLLISDSLFRCNDVALRKEYVRIVDSVKEYGGDVKLFSSLHVSGERKCKENVSFCLFVF